MPERAYDIPLFTDLTDEQQAWIVEHSTELHLDTGDYLFQEGDDDKRFYIVLDGELQIIRMVNGTQRVLANTGPGEMGGELSLLQDVPRSASARAILPTRLLIFDSRAFRDIFAELPALGFRILRTAAERMSGNATRLQHDEKLAALGKFSAGLAHELNNPASAARRAAQTLNDLLPDLLNRSVRLCTLGLTDDQIAQVLQLERDLAEQTQNAAPLSPLEQSDREEEFTAWLDGLSVADSYEQASVFVSTGLSLQELQGKMQIFPENAAQGIAAWLGSALNARSLLCEIDDSTTRISDLVLTVKEYTYRDQDQVQQVDIPKSLETTLKLMAHKLRGIEIVREYDPDLPEVTANGGELNQVWTNLLDNAADAVKDQPHPRIQLTTRCESDFVMVCIQDNGSGIPEDAMPRLFEPFFTTKEVGEGTGLGLDISYRIVSEHRGSIEAESTPGETRFIVRLPVTSAATED